MQQDQKENIQVVFWWQLYFRENSGNTQGFVVMGKAYMGTVSLSGAYKVTWTKSVITSSFNENQYIDDKFF